MDYNKVYFHNSNKDKKNYNFYDYFEPYFEKHLVIEGNWEDSFESFTNDVEALSILSYDSIIDLAFIPKFLPKIKGLYIQAKNVKSEDCLINLEKLEHFSFLCFEQKVISFDFLSKLNLKSITIDWKSKYVVNDFPNSLEYLSIENGKNIDWQRLLNSLNKIEKLELINCDIHSSKNIFARQSLRYLSLVNCKNIIFEEAIANTSIKYISFQKIPLNNLEWIKFLPNLDILVLENCGAISDIYPLSNTYIRGIWLSGSTKILNGDLKPIKEMDTLENLFIASYKHYSDKFTSNWDWKNFGAPSNSQ